MLAEWKDILSVFCFFYPCDFDTSEIAIFEAFKVAVSSVSLFHVAC